MKASSRQDTRQRIIAAALDLFGRAHDVRRVSLESIAREARVSPTTVYNHFGTRENLLVELIKHLTRQSMERNRALVSSEAPFPRKLTGIISGKVDMASRVGDEIIAKMVSQDESIAPFVEDVYREEIRPLWRDLLADGKRQGYIDPALDDAALIAYLDAMRAGFSARPEILQNFRDNMEMIKQLTNLMFYGFLKKEIDLFGKEDN